MILSEAQRGHIQIRLTVRRILGKEDAMTSPAPKEEYTYQVDKITFVVTPVYKETGELMRDILLKLMLSEVGT